MPARGLRSGRGCCGLRSPDGSRVLLLREQLLALREHLLLLHQQLLALREPPKTLKAADRAHEEKMKQQKAFDNAYTDVPPPPEDEEEDTRGCSTRDTIISDRANLDACICRYLQILDFS